LLIGFVLLLAFRALQLLRPRDERLPLLRRGFWTDLAQWAFTPFVTRAITRITVLVAIVPVGHAALRRGRQGVAESRLGLGPATHGCSLAAIPPSFPPA
jgi:hypothetical protein